MSNPQSFLVWAFGVTCAVIMLGGLTKRRRNLLVETLRSHVEKRIGKPSADEPEEAGEEAEPEE